MISIPSAQKWNCLLVSVAKKKKTKKRKTNKKPLNFYYMESTEDVLLNHCMTK